MTKERAEESWAARGPQNELRMSPAEDQEISAIWQTMPGWSCFMSAFFHAYPVHTLHNLDRRSIEQ